MRELAIKVARKYQSETGHPERYRVIGCHGSFHGRTFATLAAAGEQTKQVLTEYAKAFETGRVEDNRAFYAALEKLESQRITDLLSLKKDVDTVAVLTDAGLRQLASYTQPANFSNSPQN